MKALFIFLSISCWFGALYADTTELQPDPDKVRAYKYLQENIDFISKRDVDNDQMAKFLTNCQVLTPSVVILRTLNELDILNRRLNREDIINFNLPNDAMEPGICPYCKGTGKNMDFFCGSCRGKGKTLRGVKYNEKLAKKAYSERAEKIEKWLATIREKDLLPTPKIKRIYIDQAEAQENTITPEFAVMSQNISPAKKPPTAKQKTAKDVDNIIYLGINRHMLDFGSCRGRELEDLYSRFEKLDPPQSLDASFKEIIWFDLALRSNRISVNLSDEFFDQCPACEGILEPLSSPCTNCPTKKGFVLNQKRVRDAYDKQAQFIQMYLEQELNLHKKNRKISQPNRTEIRSYLLGNLRSIKIGHNVSTKEMSDFRANCLRLSPDEEIKAAVNELEAINLKFNKAQISDSELPTDAFTEGNCSACKGSGRRHYMSRCSGDWGIGNCYSCNGKGRTIVNPAFNNSSAKKAYAKRINIIEDWLNSLPENGDLQTAGQKIDPSSLLEDLRSIQNGNQVSVAHLSSFKKGVESLEPPEGIREILNTMEIINKKLNNLPISEQDLPLEVYNSLCRNCDSSGNITTPHGTQSCPKCYGVGRPAHSSYNTTNARKAYKLRAQIVKKWLESQIHQTQ